MASSSGINRTVNRISVVLRIPTILFDDAYIIADGVENEVFLMTTKGLPSNEACITNGCDQVSSVKRVFNLDQTDSGL